MKKKLLILFLTGIACLFLNNLVFCQQQEEDYQWVWGEATYIDVSNKTINVKYLDYESDTEKELLLNIDNKTKFEGANSLADIKINDTLSIDYSIENNKNIARTISVERLPEPGSESVSAENESMFP